MPLRIPESPPRVNLTAKIFCCHRKGGQDMRLLRNAKPGNIMGDIAGFHAQ